MSCSGEPRGSNPEHLPDLAASVFKFWGWSRGQSEGPCVDPKFHPQSISPTPQIMEYGLLCLRATPRGAQG